MTKRAFSDEIRAAVDASGQSRYAICKALGLDQGAMSRFMSGRAGLSLEVLDRLAELLDLHLAPTRPPKKRNRA